MAQELELKVTVDSEEFDRCLSALQTHTGQAGDTYVQVNYYFDTPDFALSRARSMLRVRSKKGRLFLQYKSKRSRNGGMLLCEELEAELPELPREVNPRDCFPQAPDLLCTLRGDLVTWRTDFALPGAVVSLDRSIYFGRTDLEIEIEGESEAIEVAAAFLNPQGKSEGGNGKFSRFVKAYRAYYTDRKGEET
jgi:uncharacterized protein YjbK